VPQPPCARPRSVPPYASRLMIPCPMELTAFCSQVRDPAVPAALAIVPASCFFPLTVGAEWLIVVRTQGGEAVDPFAALAFSHRA